MKYAVFWNYKFADMQETWKNQIQWLTKALNKRDYRVVFHPNFGCEGVSYQLYESNLHNPCDIVIYNHTDMSHLQSNVVKAKHTWFFKPSPPTPYHTTLDTLGYGPYSQLTYSNPDYMNENGTLVNMFFDTTVKEWIEQRTNKWGGRFVGKDEDLPVTDYYLVLGQCSGDEVVTHHDFGDYRVKMHQVVSELVRVTDRPIVVKLHPYADGKDATDTVFSDAWAKQLRAISPRVHVYTGMSNVHRFIEKCRCVFLANSGAGLEVMMHGKPIVCWGYPEYHHVCYDLRHIADIWKAVKLDWFDSEAQRKFFYWYCEKWCYHDEVTCDKVVHRLINRV